MTAAHVCRPDSVGGECGRSREWWQGRIDWLASQAEHASAALSFAVGDEFGVSAGLVQYDYEAQCETAAAEKAFRRALFMVSEQCAAAAWHGHPGMKPSC